MHNISKSVSVSTEIHRAQHAAMTLALWANALRAGAPADEFLAAVASTDISAGVRAGSIDLQDLTEIPGPGEPTAPIVSMLALLRGGGPAQLILPVAGDMRGLPPNGTINRSALAAGAVVVLPQRGLGIVPAAGHWRIYRCAATCPDLSTGQVESELAEAVRAATRTLSGLSMVGASAEQRRCLRELIETSQVIVPADAPVRTTQLLERTATVAAMMTVVSQSYQGAVSAAQGVRMSDALAPLGTAVRQAQRTAISVYADSVEAAAPTAARRSRQPKSPTPRIHRRP